MTTISSAAAAGLPAGVSGTADPRFASAVRTFARLFAGRRGIGGALSVYQHGEPVVDVWAGASDTADTPWSADTGAMIYSASKGVSATVLHRLADRGLLDYAAPVAEYWPEFAANGKARITVAQLLSHRAGLSALPATTAAEVLDHELMQQRLAAAAPDHLLGVPIYHALTIGWLMSGLAHAITGRDMAALYRSEIAEPLGVDGIHLGRPPLGSRTVGAELVGSVKDLAERSIPAPVAALVPRLPRLVRDPLSALYVPGLESIFRGPQPAILATALPAGNAVCTASALARMYSALACDGRVDGRAFLSPVTVRELERVRTYRLDHSLLVPLWHLGYHSLPAARAPRGYGHMGAFGSTGWADPRSGIAVGFVHNRMSLAWSALDQTFAVPLLHLILRAARRPARPAATPLDTAA
ncbi:class A beta-lactamase-related serine hydrolase [Nocardia yunnanensis]|uniref:Class A beta-lactamase-related serine hydrolase n=1 Tax=Nocardia yunnanensis TaxID=2382165 RepID=A0A386ZNV7_9NOCA|nr:serine hydrolase domain-containing protein [Nocardia yunnanensis]AYF79118.1 class A beta-lactamase-related serine hydrolase [Nocardia yunnanensis]